jgi:hypothetical protein
MPVLAPYRSTAYVNGKASGFPKAFIPSLNLDNGASNDNQQNEQNQNHS